MALYISKSKNTNVCSVAWFCPNQIFIDHKTVEVETFALLPLWIIISLYPCSEHVFSPGTCNTPTLVLGSLESALSAMWGQVL